MYDALRACWCQYLCPNDAILSHMNEAARDKLERKCLTGLAALRVLLKDVIFDLHLLNLCSPVLGCGHLPVVPMPAHVPLRSCVKMAAAHLVAQVAG